MDVFKKRVVRSVDAESYSTNQGLANYSPQDKSRYNILIWKNKQARRIRKLVTK